MTLVEMHAESTFERDGFCVVPDVLHEEQRRALIDILAEGTLAQSRRNETTYGARNLLADARIRGIAQSQRIRSLADQLAGAPTRPVRGLFFDKTAGANWRVPWHQDLVLAVAARHEIAGWGPWSVKAGVHHVEAPSDRLARMVTLRLHIDDCDADNGPLRALPGSHRLGRLRAADIKRVREERSKHICLAPAGAALAMRPLLVHASSSASQPRHRRVLHLEFAPDDLLPSPLAWTN